MIAAGGKLWCFAVIIGFAKLQVLRTLYGNHIITLGKAKLITFAKGKFITLNL